MMTGEETPEVRPFEQLVLLRLDEIERRLERVLTMVCPVCGPKLVAEIHPPDDVPTLALVSSNGEHGR